MAKGVCCNSNEEHYALDTGLFKNNQQRAKGRSCLRYGLDLGCSKITVMQDVKIGSCKLALSMLMLIMGDQE
jgi:hypothetical protein